ncbi:HsdM family class I SAM-dependent methyltransferase [Elizabethkingia anophelis]|uniref:site-specific DNA-methyltransferase (adenine-specific) n=2 Tax=Elizabethkingia anophelis TaxID=1117645 RepID=A0A077EHW7_9FLAO|nr:N-6 DNA methylase [Elizabethkingia anophelis]AIL46103.1 Adenine-specific methyltransferase activity Eco57IA [Elizabethkingia anophelis NUHP1]
MNLPENIVQPFSQGLQKLGFEGDDLLFLVDDQNLPEPLLKFHLETAKDLGASAVYFRLQLNGSYKPQVYLFDFTEKSLNEEDTSIADIQTNLWSSGEVPLACFFFNTEIKIVDCTKHVTKKFHPEYLISDLNLVGKAHDLYNEQFAVKIKTGLFWEQEELKKKFKFQNSAYDTLIKNIRSVSEKLKTTHSDSASLINKIIVQAILIKYLEERIDTNGNKLLSEKYFKKYENASTFNEVLRKGKFVALLIDLNQDFNGNVFTWTEEEQKQLQSLDLNILADFLSTDKADISSQQTEFDFDLRYFEFKYIPVELISRLYEEFLGEDKQEKGLFYTPSHLAKLLVDECIPLKKYEGVDLKDFKILDPACGSGIFLVVTFKRLVQIWRLQNEMKFPDIKDLKPLLKNIYGVDKEEQAIKLASFSLSLALCNELNPIKIINELRFDDLTEENLIWSDFFQCDSIKGKKFDLVIGNPPFVRGAISNYSNKWVLENKSVTIPQGQIALKFLSEAFSYLKEGGLSCLIIKSSGLLYNSTSNDYKKALFSNYNVVQIFDFTALARNKSLWDNGADVASAAIFVRNEKPDFSKNLLHLTFRRTIATKERIFFEIDDYDFHFVNRQTAINNEFVWKNNLLGGGRIRNLVEKVQSIEILETFLDKNNCICEEGLIGSSGNLWSDLLKNIPFLPTRAISESGIDYNQLEPINEQLSFVKIPNQRIFSAPNIILWENIGEKDLPVFFNDQSFSFRHQIIGIKSDNTELLNVIIKELKDNNDFYRFYMYVTSSYLLINRNTSLLKNDYMNLPFLKDENMLSEFDSNIISDVNTYFQAFIRNGEKSKAISSIKGEKNIKSIIGTYGIEFSRALNTVYGENNRREFRLSDVVELNNSLIATVFKFDTENTKPIFHKDLSKLNIENLTDNVISEQLSVKRIIKLYPQKDTIVFIKPNQYRYWLSLTAYRDADKCFSDFSNAGF